jgi:hypothetical protein
VSADGRILELKKFADGAKYGYGDVANFNAAALQAETGEVGGEIETLKSIIASAYDESYRNLAIIKLAMVSEYTETESGMEDSLKLLGGIGKGDPFRHAARLVSGVLYLKKNDLARAKDALDALADDEDAPAGTKSQALAILSLIKSETSRR